MSEPPWLKIARSYLGLREGPGTADNPRAVELYRLAGHPEVRHDSVAPQAFKLGKGGRKPFRYVREGG